MAFLFRTLTVVIGAAFLLAVANLLIQGTGPAGDAETEIAAASPAPSPDSPQTLRDVLSTAFSSASRPEATQRSAPGAIAAAQPATPLPVSPPTATAAELEAIWRSWMAENGLTTGALVVLQPDGAMHRASLDRDTATRVPVASLSKAITGICLDIVLQEQGLGWYTRLRDIAPQMSAVRVTPQAWNEDLTLAALVTHTSGLAPDLTQGTMGNTLHGALGLHRRIASEALREENMQGNPREFFYSNTNYAVLGVVIEALSGQSYAQACMDRVITPAGITDAVIEGRMGSRSSYGGWEMSAEDHARLAQFWLSAGNPAIDSPTTRPMRDHYALGYIIRGAGTQAHVTHSGRFCYDDGRDEVGAYFHARGDGTVVSANWAGCIAAGDGDLADAISDAMR